MRSRRRSTGSAARRGETHLHRSGSGRPRAARPGPGHLSEYARDVSGDDQRLSRRGSFDEDPDNYQAARPGYPPRVYEVLAECGLRPGARVLEIGPGTGQVTRPLVDAGTSVLAVELGGWLAARLRTNLTGQDVTVIEGDFATVPLPDDTFDLAVCAIAFPRAGSCGVHAV
ncbi:MULTISPECIES: class I SAM-dependent methyltransferase [unclassified Micromonospora]|uniref:class I SAM-dependent methyltransferase n=1 Tax=Micromonospora TaxID=1873 RepID=UPI001FD7E55A|nr:MULTISPECIES: methyltransferase domain-containing protein [unclassified Micromonospora]